jgi:trans-2,3-dihydro-3-hydroxyanthranilate isomerase
MVYVFALTAEGRALARFFFAQGSSALEDPATGSATANLGGWLTAMKQGLPRRLEISQGEYVNRPSSLTLEVDSEERIFVSGAVIELGRGAVSLPDARPNAVGRGALS